MVRTTVYCHSRAVSAPGHKLHGGSIVMDDASGSTCFYRLYVGQLASHPPLHTTCFILVVIIHYDREGKLNMIRGQTKVSLHTAGSVLLTNRSSQVSFG